MRVHFLLWLGSDFHWWNSFIFTYFLFLWAMHFLMRVHALNSLVEFFWILALLAKLLCQFFLLLYLMLGVGVLWWDRAHTQAVSLFYFDIIFSLKAVLSNILTTLPIMLSIITRKIWWDSFFGPKFILFAFHSTHSINRIILPRPTYIFIELIIS